jgi:hypothetical protein
LLNHQRDVHPKINHHGVNNQGMGKDHAMRDGHEARDAGLDVPTVDHLKVLAAPIR